MGSTREKSDGRVGRRTKEQDKLNRPWQEGVKLERILLLHGCFCCNFNLSLLLLSEGTPTFAAG